MAKSNKGESYTARALAGGGLEALEEGVKAYRDQIHSAVASVPLADAQLVLTALQKELDSMSENAGRAFG